MIMVSVTALPMWTSPQFLRLWVRWHSSDRMMVRRSGAMLCSYLVQSNVNGRVYLRLAVRVLFAVSLRTLEMMYQLYSHQMFFHPKMLQSMLSFSNSNDCVLNE